ncbi:MAG: hypothetical protein GY754_27775 [bacterium]|nr:hypothetical protein [bacterium]
MKKKFVYGLILLLFCGIFTGNFLYSQDKKDNSKWMRMSGRWKIENSYAVERKRGAGGWFFHDILEYNSLASRKNFEEFSSIDLKMNLYNPRITRRMKNIKDPVRMMAFFAAKSLVPGEKYQYYLTNFYAFKLSGNKDRITKVSFVRSDIIDSSVSKPAKKNYRVTELRYKLYKLDLNKDHIMSIKFKDKKATLFINGEEVLQANIPENYEGRVGFSAQNIAIKVDYYKVSNNEAVIFDDQFNRNSIFVRTVRGKFIKNKKK